MSNQDINYWKLFLGGNKSAFEMIINDHFKHLFHYGTKFTDDDELVKDTIQELFIRLWDKRLNLSDDVNPKAYLTASLRRALHRKIQSLRKFVNFSEVENGLDAFDFEVSVEEDFISNEEVRSIAYRMAANLSVLPERQREVIYLKFFRDLSRPEISDAMGITPQTVSNLLQLALKKLRITMESLSVFKLYK